ncbi:uncharacterized protein LOC142348692 [Convolutriloba macropyga]|uniref:uncharacterized protein LOC142348692 n=1 Tax=Convolutriloba macropyga TaxID=536237 RepID=UPI003F51F46E
MDLVDVDAETIDTNAVVIEENNQENETDNKKGLSIEDVEASESVPLFDSFPVDDNNMVEAESAHDKENQPLITTSDGTDEEMDTAVNEAGTEELEQQSEELSIVSGLIERTTVEISATETEAENVATEGRDHDVETVGESTEIQEETRDETEPVDEEVHESRATENQSSMEEPVVIDDDEVGETGEPEQQKFSVFPLAKVKKIMKTDPDTHLISKEAILLTAKATELFLREFASFSYEALKETKRKTISKKEFDAVLELVEPYCFLDGIFYETAANEEKDEEIVEVQSTTVETSN